MSPSNGPTLPQKLRILPQKGVTSSLSKLRIFPPRRSGSLPHLGSSSVDCGGEKTGESESSEAGLASVLPRMLVVALVVAVRRAGQGGWW